MSYLHNYLIVAAGLSAADSARLLFAAYGESPGDADPATSQNCRAEYAAAADPTGPVTHYAAEFLCTEPQRQALEAIDNAGQTPAGVYYWRRDRDGVLQATNHPSVGVVGQPADAATILDGLSLARKVYP